MYCKNCGRQLDDNMNFCVYCGCNLSENAGKKYPENVRKLSGTDK